MINNKPEKLNTLIKLDIEDLIDNHSESNENKENSENYNNSNKDYSSINTPDLKLDEEEQHELKENMKNNPKNINKKSKGRRGKFAIDPQEDTTPQHPKKIYTEEEKLKKANENTIYFNWSLIDKRNELNNHFLKRKIEQNYERDDNKMQVFFNVPFFPKEEIFMSWQIAQNNNYLYNLNRNAQYNKMGMPSNRNMNYPNGIRYMNNNINNNNMIKNNNVGNMNNMKNYGQSNMNTNNINNTQSNIKNQNNFIQPNKNQNNNINNNKINPAPTQNNNNINNIPYSKPAKPILDTSLLNDSKKISPINKLDTNNIKKNPLFALTTDLPNNNNKIEMNQSSKKENENNNEIKPISKEENTEVKEIDIDNKENNKK